LQKDRKVLKSKKKWFGLNEVPQHQKQQNMNNAYAALQAGRRGGKENSDYRHRVPTATKKSIRVFTST